MDTYAVVDPTGLCLNVIVWDGASSYSVEGGLELRKVGTDSPAAPGYRWVPPGLWQPPAPYPSWVFDYETGSWSAPTDPPPGNESWVWDETTLTWVAD